MKKNNDQGYCRCTLGGCGHVDSGRICSAQQNERINNVKIKLYLVALAIGFISVVPSAQATLVVDAVYDASDYAAYAGNISDTDLLKTANVESSTGTWNGDGVAGLTDGLYGIAYGGWVNPVYSDPAATVTFDLGTGANGTGWDLDTFRSISAFGNAALANQEFILEYKTVGGADFITLGTFGPVNVSALAGADYQATQITLTDDSSTIASGAQFVRFTGRPTTASNPGYRELDLFGTSTAIPEPATIGIMGFGALAALFIRRRFMI